MQERHILTFIVCTYTHVPWAWRFCKFKARTGPSIHCPWPETWRNQVVIDLLVFVITNTVKNQRKIIVTLAHSVFWVMPVPFSQVPPKSPPSVGIHWSPSLIRGVKVKIPRKIWSRFWEMDVLFMWGTILDNPRMKNISDPKEKKHFCFRPHFLVLTRKILYHDG